jgi:hypothetical protein
MKMNISKMIYEWEQFKGASDEAVKLYKDNGKSYVVYIPNLKIFQATVAPNQTNPVSGSPADKIVITFDDPLNDVYSFQNISLNEVITAFDMWYSQNADKDKNLTQYEEYCIDTIVEFTKRTRDTID